MSALDNYYLQQLGITRWTLRNPEPETSLSDLLPETTATQATSEWPVLEQCVTQCTACSLAKTRTQTVFGTGSRRAKLMFIGEAPGADEDRQGKPFVGRAGQLLTEMLRAIGLDREEVFIANILKCRPPNNRDPSAEEVQKCTPFLLQQINLIQPQLLISLGRISAHYLLNTTTALSRLRNQIFHYGENKTPLIITYHPAYLLRSPQDKAKAYDDLLRIKNFLN